MEMGLVLTRKESVTESSAEFLPTRPGDDACAFRPAGKPFIHMPFGSFIEVKNDKMILSVKGLYISFLS